MVSSRHALVEMCRATAILGLCGAFLFGCSNKTTSQSGASQVVAHVGDEDVTTQELENEFRLANVPADKQKDPAVIKQVMGELVLRHYLMQQAVTDKLDREPGVLLDIMRARAQVLANAYLSRSVAAKPISQEDVDKYIADNPLKFADRQLLSVEQVVFPIGPKAQAAIDASKNMKSLDQVDQELSSMSIPHNRVMGSLSTAEIPEQLFKVIQAKKADDAFFVRSGQNGVFFKVVGEEPRPLSGDQATNLARQLIRADQFKAEIGAATTAANLEAKYEGDYAGIMNDRNGAAPGTKN